METYQEIVSHYFNELITNPIGLLLQILGYLFWPNPGEATYESPKAVLLLTACALLIIASLGISFWRKKIVSNSVTKKLSRTWSSAAFWFGLTGLVFVVSRVEGISYLSMRFLWVLWILAVLGYLYAQWRFFRARHYEVLPREDKKDPRAKYLPKKKK